MAEKFTSRSTTTQITGLEISIVICFAAAAIGGYPTQQAIDGWYTTISQPTWNPPNWIFGPVWSTLYLMMAILTWLTLVRLHLCRA